MKKVIWPALLVNLIVCLILVIFFFIKEDGSAALYYSILIFGCILVPTIIAVGVFRIIEKKTILKNRLTTILFQIILLATIYVSALYLWAVADVLLFDELTIVNINKDFSSQFLGFIPIAMLEAILIPIVFGSLNKTTVR